MRIVGGQWRGHPIEAPDGRDVTRPTTDRVREAVSSMLLSARGLSLDGARVLDALCTFVDLDRGACARVRRNASALGADASALAVVRGDAMRLAGAGIQGVPFDVVVLDPPYATDAALVSGLVEALDQAGSLSADALVLYERSASAPALAPAGFVSLKQKRYGQTAVDLLGRDS